MKKFYIFLSMVIAALTAGAGTVSEVITTSSFVEGTTGSFADMGSYTAPSGNVYKAKGRAFNKGSIDFCLSASASCGLVVSEIKEGELRKVVLDWPNVAAGSVMEVYGSDYPFAYSAMFNNSVESIGNITKVDGEKGEFEVPADCKYVGVRPASGILYVSSITFEYETAGAPAPTKPVITFSAGENGRLNLSNTITWNTVVNGGEIELGTVIGYNATANDGYVIEQLTINGEVIEAATNQLSYNSTFTVEGDTDVKVTFKAAAAAKPVITFSAGENGRLNLSNQTTWDPVVNGGEVELGDLIGYNATANGDYLIDELTINGEVIEAATNQPTYYSTFTVEGDTEVKVTFKAKVVNYTINYTLEGDGTLSIFDPDFTALSNGATVEAGTELTIVAIATDGNIIEEFSINGETATDENGENGLGLDRFYFDYTVESDLDIKVVFKSEDEPAPTDYCNNYEGVSSTHTGRYLNTVTFTSGDETLTVTAQTKYKDEIYKDKTDEVFEITPGSSINIKCNGNGEWMHGYAWVDWNRDYVFTPDFDGHAVTANSELVAFNYYDGYDSNGVDAADNSNGFVADLNFNVPEDITYGDYRFRFIIDWDCIDPCGNPNSGQSLAKNGGCILDVTLRYSEPDGSGVEAIEAAEEVAPVYYNLQGVRVANPANGVFIKVAGNKAEKVYLNK